MWHFALRALLPARMSLASDDTDHQPPLRSRRNSVGHFARYEPPGARRRTRAKGAAGLWRRVMRGTGGA